MRPAIRYSLFGEIMAWIWVTIKFTNQIPLIHTGASAVKWKKKWTNRKSMPNMQVTTVFAKWRLLLDATESAYLSRSIIRPQCVSRHQVGICFKEYNSPTDSKTSTDGRSRNIWSDKGDGAIGPINSYLPSITWLMILYIIEYIIKIKQHILFL